MRTFVFRLTGPRPMFALDMTDQERELMARHAAYWQRYVESGQMVFFGPVLDGTGSWGLGIVESDDEAEIRAFAAADPVVTAGTGTIEVGTMLGGFIRPHPPQEYARAAGGEELRRPGCSRLHTTRSSRLARALLAGRADPIAWRDCARYIHAVQQMSWFTAAFAGYAMPVTVTGGQGRSHADAARRSIKIGTSDRHSLGGCEQACLHELAHIVTPDYGPGRQRREPALGEDSSNGHHHAWRVNFVLIVRKTLGSQAAARLRSEFSQWGLPGPAGNPAQRARCGLEPPFSTRRRQPAPGFRAAGPVALISPARCVVRVQGRGQGRRTRARHKGAAGRSAGRLLPSSG